MRWPFHWPDRRSDVHADGADADAVDAEADAIDAEADAAGPPGPRGRAWADLPPLAPTVERAPLTAPSLEFATELSGSRPLDAILRPLGHEVAADGPGGLIGGVAQPIIDTRVRSVSGSTIAWPAGTSARASRRGLSGGSDTAAATGDNAAAPGAELFEPAPSAIAPSRSLSPVAPATRETRHRLTAVEPASAGWAVASMGSALSTEPAVAAAAPDADVPAEMPAPPRATPPGADGIPAGGLLGASASSVARAASDLDRPWQVARASSGEGSPGSNSGAAGGHRPVIRRTSTGAQRVAGLGAPIAGPPPIAIAPPARTGLAPAAPEPLQGLPRHAPPLPPASGGGDLPLATLGAATRDGAVEDAASAPASTTARAADVEAGSGGPSARAGVGPEFPLETDRPRRRRGSHPGPAQGDKPSVAVSPAAAPIALPVRPILARRLLWPAGAVGGAEEPGAAGPAEAGDQRPVAPPPSARLPASPDGSPAEDAAHAIQRLVATPVARAEAPPRSPAGAPLAGPAWTVGGPRSAAHGHRDPGDIVPGAAGPRESGPVTGPPLSLAAVRAHREPPTAPEPAPGPSMASSAAVAPATATRWSAIPEPPPGGPAAPATIQRAIEVSEVTSETRGTEEGAGGGFIPATASDEQLDLLARRLYGRMRDRLAGELLLDRERAGMLADV